MGLLAVLNFPDLRGLRWVYPRVDDRVRDAGIEQGWGMFVFRPDPSPSSQVVRARLAYADGRVVTWRPPEDRFLGAQRAARWAKLGEFARPRSHGEGGTAGQELWRPLASWLARTYPGVTRVELVALDHEIPEIGQRARPPWTERVFYVYEP